MEKVRDLLSLLLSPDGGDAPTGGPLKIGELDDLDDLQLERLSEIMAGSNASGAALIIEEDSQPEVSFQRGLLSSVTDQVIESLKAKKTPRPGLLFSQPAGTGNLHLFLLTDQCPERTRFLIQLYLTVWSELYLQHALRGANSY